jgi:hypothetical protein
VGWFGDKMPLGIHKSTRRRRFAKLPARPLLTMLVGGGVLWGGFLIFRPMLLSIAIERFAAATNTEITARTADFHLDGEFFAEDLVIRPRTPRPDYNDAIFTAKRLRARFTRGSLITMNPKLVEMSVRDFSLNAVYDADANTWNIGTVTLRAPAKNDAHELPEITLKQGKLHLSRTSAGHIENIASTPLDAKAGVIENGEDWYGFEILTAQRKGGDRSCLKGWLRGGTAALKGGLATFVGGDNAEAMSIELMTAEASCDETGQFSLDIKVEDLLNQRSSARKLLEGGVTFTTGWKSAEALQRFYNRFRPAGKVDMNLNATGNLASLCDTQFAGRILCEDVSVCDVKFPYLIEHIKGPIYLSTQRAAIDNLQGRHGNTTFSVNGYRSLAPDRNYLIELASDNMPLDDDLYAALSDGRKRAWDKFTPQGTASIKYQESRQSKKTSILTVGLHDASAVYEKFPYPLKNLSGTLVFEREKIVVSNLVSDCNERKIIINGQVTSPDRAEQIYDITIESSDIPLDSTLEQALTEEQRRYYGQICIGGVADANIEVFTPGDGSPEPDWRACVSLKDATLKAGRLPMVIEKAKGRVIFTPSTAEIEELVGSCGDHTVKLTGNIRPDPNKPSYDLQLTGEGAEVNGKVLELISEKMRAFLTAAQASGRINYRADIISESPTKEPEHVITAECLGNSLMFPQFLYPLENIRGKVIITDNKIQLEDISGSSACAVRVSDDLPIFKVNGSVLFDHENFSRANLTVSASNVCLDNRLKTALPKSAQKFYEHLAPTGFVGIDNLDVSIFDAAANEKLVEFEGALALKDAGFDIGPDISQLDATVRCEGLWSTERGLVSAESSITADTLRISHKLNTNLKTEVGFGEKQTSWRTSELVADFYGGKVTGKLELNRPPAAKWRYDLQTTLTGVDLARFQADGKGTVADNGHDSGTLNGIINLAADIGPGRTPLGVCKLHVTDMRAGKLSPLARVLNVLRLNEPGDFAFKQALIDSYIKDGKMLLRRLDISGDSLAFTGAGSMDMETDELNVVLMARGKRLATADPSLWQSLTDCMGMAMVRMEITGPLHNPHVSTEALPALRNSLGILGTEPLASKK